MNFGFSEEQEMLRATIGKFMKNECSVQYVRECDEGQKVPFEVFHKIADQGWLGLAVPEEYGGSGGTIIDLAILLEETAKVSLALADLIYRARVHGGMNMIWGCRYWAVTAILWSLICSVTSGILAL